MIVNKQLVLGSQLSVKYESEVDVANIFNQVSPLEKISFSCTLFNQKNKHITYSGFRIFIYSSRNETI